MSLRKAFDQGARIICACAIELKRVQRNCAGGGALFREGTTMQVTYHVDGTFSIRVTRVQLLLLYRIIQAARLLRVLAR